MILSEFSKAVAWACSNNQDEAARDILTQLLTYANEPGVNLADVREQIACMLAEIEDYTPEPNDLQRVNLICRDFPKI